MKQWNRKVKKKLNESSNNNYVEVSSFKVSKLTRREFILTILTVLTITSFTLGSSYALFSDTELSSNYNIIESGDLEITFENDSNGIGNLLNLNGAYPINDVDGMNTNGYSFKITNTGSLAASYKIKIINDTGMIAANDVAGNLIDHSNIKISIDGSDPVLLSSFASNDYIVDMGVVNALTSNTHNIKMWIDETADNDILGKSYHGKIVVEAEQYDGKYLDDLGLIVEMNGANPLNIEQGSVFTDPSVVDATNVEVTYEYCNASGVCSAVTSIDTNVPGAYLVYYTKKTNNDNDGVTVRSVYVFATEETGPVFTLTGNSVVTQLINTVYTDPGYSANDAVDGNVTANMVVSSSPNIAIEGSYLIKYIASDNSGNYTMATRIVEVVSKLPTAENCFAFSSNTITSYSTACPVDVVLPRRINNSAVLNIGSAAFTPVAYFDPDTDEPILKPDPLKIESVVIPNSVLFINDFAFLGYADDQDNGLGTLESVVMGDGVHTIGTLAFSYNAISYLELSSGLTSIGWHAFRINQLSKVVFPENLVTLSESVFANNKIEEFELNDNITTLPVGTFAHNELTEVVLPENITTIGISVFGNNNISKLTLSSNITTIPTEAFVYNNLQELIIPNSVTTININAFASSNIEKLTLGDNVQSIGNYAFGGNAIESVTIPASVTTLGHSVFLDNEISSVKVLGKNSESDFTSAGTNWYGIATVEYIP